MIYILLIVGVLAVTALLLYLDINKFLTEMEDVIAGDSPSDIPLLSKVKYILPDWEVLPSVESGAVIAKYGDRHFRIADRGTHYSVTITTSKGHQGLLGNEIHYCNSRVVYINNLTELSKLI